MSTRYDNPHDALKHILSCERCRISHTGPVACTICQKVKKWGYIATYRCPEMGETYWKKLDRYINWGACDECLEGLGIDISNPNKLSRIGATPDIIDDLKKSIEDFKKRITHVD